VEWNEKINLTAIAEESDVYLKHFYDSIAPILQGHIQNEPIQLLILELELDSLAYQ
jgi:16S rRNA (guanine527-N7)-methyltransferase